MKVLNVVFWCAVAGVVVSLGGTVYTAVAQHRAQKATEVPAASIVVPAVPQQH